MDRMSSGKKMIQFNVFSFCFSERKTTQHFLLLDMGNYNRITLNVLLIAGAALALPHFRMYSRTRYVVFGLIRTFLCNVLTYFVIFVNI